jgi:hypothetical protein
VAKSPQQELEEFLASKPAWMQRALQHGESSLTRGEWTELINCGDELSRQRTEYERILQFIPAKWREYRKMRKREAQQMLHVLLPQGKPGAPRKDDLAREAERLQQRGMSFPQIAGELNKRLGEDNKTTPEAIRMLLKRHSQPNKT